MPSGAVVKGSQSDHEPVNHGDVGYLLLTHAKYVRVSRSHFSSALAKYLANNLQTNMNLIPGILRMVRFGKYTEPVCWQNYKCTDNGFGLANDTAL